MNRIVILCNSAIKQLCQLAKVEIVMSRICGVGLNRNRTSLNIAAIIAHKLINLSVGIHNHFTSAARALHN